MRRRPRAALIKTINLDGGGRLFLSGSFFFLAALCPRTTLTEMINITAPACVGSWRDSVALRCGRVYSEPVVVVVVVVFSVSLGTAFIFVCYEMMCRVGKPRQSRSTFSLITGFFFLTLPFGAVGKNWLWGRGFTPGPLD